MDSQKQVEPVGEPVLDRSRVPHHVAIIMDGNGRWAQSRHLPRVAGHHRKADGQKGNHGRLATWGLKP